MGGVDIFGRSGFSPDAMQGNNIIIILYFSVVNSHKAAAHNIYQSSLKKISQHLYFNFEKHKLLIFIQKNQRGR
jgi:hypothetical protein